MRTFSTLSLFALTLPVFSMPNVAVRSPSPEALAAPQPLTPAPVEPRTWNKWNNWDGPSACDNHDKRQKCYEIGKDCNEKCVCIPWNDCGAAAPFWCNLWHGQLNCESSRRLVSPSLSPRPPHPGLPRGLDLAEEDGLTFQGIPAGAPSPPSSPVGQATTESESSTARPVSLNALSTSNPQRRSASTPEPPSTRVVVAQPKVPVSTALPSPTSWTSHAKRVNASFTHASEVSNSRTVPPVSRTSPSTGQRVSSWVRSRVPRSSGVTRWSDLVWFGYGTDSLLSTMGFRSQLLTQFRRRSPFG